jgi:hypothetical protein
MSKSVLQSAILRDPSLLSRFLFKTILAFLCLGCALLFIGKGTAQETVKPAPALPPTPFRINERITYNVSFGRWPNAAYAEIYAVSRGKIGERDAVELRSRIKTLDLTGALYLLDQSRTTFAGAESGLPLYVVKTETEGVMPKESIDNYLTNPITNYDLLTLLYQARNSGGSGTYTLQEAEKTYSVTFQPGGNEKVKTDAGEFDTTISTVQSDFFTQSGILDLRINFSTDDQRVPALIRFRTAKGDFRASVASIQVIEPEVEPETVTPQPPRPNPTPRPVPTATPYVDNLPLLPEVSFVLGETLEYKISSGGQPIGNITLRAKERKFTGQDSLLLTADVSSVTGQGTGLFRAGDFVRTLVNPDTLSPQQIDIRFTGGFSLLNQTAVFDQRTGGIMVGGANRVESPVGTHNLLSLIYAIRSFNLKPSKNPNNPVNDTRVAVFWDKRPYVFTLRPSDAEIINLQGQRTSAQLITINTGNPQLDALGLKIWLSNDKNRLPLRLAAGSYQADLVSEAVIPPK